MYAVIVSGGKQYRVQPGDFIQLEKLEGEVGTAVKFDQILMVSQPGATADADSQIWLGKPTLSGASVSAEIVGQGRGEKVRITKMKRRKQYRRNYGHRQFLTQLLVTGLSNGAGGKADLSAEDKKAKLNSFASHLKPRGPAMTPKVYVSKRTDAVQKTAAPAATTAKKAPAKKRAAASAK